VVSRAVSVMAGRSAPAAAAGAAGAVPLAFFLRFAEGEGAAFEQGRDSTLLLLPPALRQSLDLPEELTITAEPEVAREDGAVLLVHGHPLLDRAAATVLERGDAGCSHLPWPASRMPSATELVERAREHLQVDHGRIEAAGPPPVESYLPVLRAGILISYATSLEDRFQEREEVWLEAGSRLPLDAALRDFVAARTPEAGLDRRRPVLGHDLAAAAAAADALVASRALARRRELSRQTRSRREQELARASAYYEATLASITARKAAAAPERSEVLAAQIEVTTVERDRRLAEIAERFEPRHEQTPFRLHLIGVPALSLAAQVRRGARTFSLALTWVLGAARFLPVCCPHCRATATLVAGRDRLGCRECLPASPLPAHTSPASPLPAPASPASPLPAPASPASPLPAPASPLPAPASPTTAPASPATAPASSSTAPSRASAPAPGRPVSAPPAPGSRSRPRDASPAGSSSLRPPARLRPERTPGRSAVRPAVDQAHLERAGDKLARSFWTAVVSGERWRAKATVPHSPMSALARVYGHPGPLWAIGLPPGLEPLDLQVEITRAGRPAARGQPMTCHATGGAILTRQGIHHFTLRWELVQGTALVGEILPLWAPDGMLPPREEFDARTAARFFRPPAPRVALDQAASELWEESSRRFGLLVAVRCLALWWQVQALPGAPPCREAAVRLAVTQWVRGRAGFPILEHGQPALWGPEPEEIAAAIRHIRTVAGPPEHRPW
jgi:hypothetical protein